MFQVTYF